MREYSRMESKQASAAIRVRTGSYQAALAASLIEYAAGDPEFACELAALALSFEDDRRPKQAKERPPQHCRGLKLADYESAARRAAWLTDRLEREAGVAGREAVALLKGWARDYLASAPESLVVGIVGLAIPGITLGLIKRRVRVSLILDNRLPSGTSIRTAGIAVTALLDLFEVELELSGRNIDRFEPEYADWIYGERLIAVYATGTECIKELVGELRGNCLPFAMSGDESKPGALAVSPSVNILELRNGEQLKRVVVLD